MAGPKALFALSKETQIILMLLVLLETTTGQEICDSIVTMGEMLFLCYLYGEIIVHRHQPVFFVMSNTRCTQGYYKFLKISISHKQIKEKTLCS